MLLWDLVAASGLLLGWDAVAGLLWHLVMRKRAAGLCAVHTPASMLSAGVVGASV